MSEPHYWPLESYLTRVRHHIKAGMLMLHSSAAEPPVSRSLAQRTLISQTASAARLPNGRAGCLGDEDMLRELPSSRVFLLPHHAGVLTCGQGFPD